jgi:hypothetical protein
MADPDCTSRTDTTPGYTSTTSTTSNFCLTEGHVDNSITIWHNTGHIIKTAVNIIKKLIRLEESIAARKTWRDRTIRPKPFLLRPSIQLRAVCLGGRGWA